MKRFFLPLCLFALMVLWPAGRLGATANYEYKTDEYVTINEGKSPDGQYLIATHGEGELGDEHFHVYLMDARTGKKIGPLTEIKDILDTAATAYDAKWSADSRQVSISWRRDRHEEVTITYRIGDRRARRISGPTVVP